MIQSIIENEPVGHVSRRQQLFLKFTYFVLLDIVVLNLLNEFWDKVFITVVVAIIAAEQLFATIYKRLG